MDITLFSSETYTIQDFINTLHTIFYSWYNGLASIYNILFDPIQNILDYWLDFLLIPEAIGDKIAEFSTLIFGSNFTLVGVLFGGVMPVLVVFAFITLIARWVLDIWIL